MESKYAWFYLSRFQKELLQAQRRAGRFGGETSIGVGKAPYFWVQEGSTPEGRIGASKANVKPTFFVRDGIQRSEGAIWREIGIALSK